MLVPGRASRIAIRIFRETSNLSSFLCLTSVGASPRYELWCTLGTIVTVRLTSFTWTVQHHFQGPSLPPLRCAKHPSQGAVGGCAQLHTRLRSMDTGGQRTIVDCEGTLRHPHRPHGRYHEPMYPGALAHVVAHLGPLRSAIVLADPVFVRGLHREPTGGTGREAA